MDLTNFTIGDVEAVIDKVFTSPEKYISIEEAYQKLTQTMYEECFVQPGQSDIVLSRVYHSFDYYLLPGSLQQIAQQCWEGKIEDSSKLLVLMGTYGKEVAWQDRTLSKGHKAILLSEATLENIPMVSRLIQQIGFDLGVLLRNEAGASYDGITGTFGVFYVSPALGSPYIPAQDFVTQYDVKSVIGTGVMLPQGDISAYIIFSRVPIENKMAANIAPLMSMFWQKAYPLLEVCGMFTQSSEC